MARQRKPPKNTVRIQFDSRISLAKIGAALESQGIALRSNPDTLELYAVEIEAKAEKPDGR